MRCSFILAAWMLVGCGAPPVADTDGEPDDTDIPDTDPPDTAADTAGDTGLPEVPCDGGGLASAGEAIFRSQCAACHTMGRGDTTRGPDLLVADLRPDHWLEQWLTDPAAVVEWNPYAQNLVDAWGGLVMPDPELEDGEIDDVICFLAEQRATGPLEPLPPRVLTDEAFEATTLVYFDRCAGCHGTTRAGATGPELAPERAVELGTDLLGAVVRHGTPWGMPNWGTSGTLTEDEIENLAAFLQLPVPEAPSLSLDEMKASWELLVPPADRPLSPEHARDWENFFGVVLRDSGEVVVYDGDTHEEIGRVDVGFATHILRSSADGRYFLAVGRDGWVTMIDLWAAVPTSVARARGCYDARSVEVSKFAGYEDRYAIEGCYWPPQYAVFDGATLEPLAVHSVLGDAVDTGEPLDEVRVALIAASPYAPAWFLALKESGHVAIVDYSDPGLGIATKLPAVRYLHDGGWDATQRYLILAANASDQMVVVDALAQEVVATFPTGSTPHPGRGANWVDPVYGPVNATVHLGEGLLAVYGADPAGHPEHAWTVVREVALPSSGSLFLKTHPASPWVLMDMTLGADEELSRQVCAWSKDAATLDRCFSVADHGRATHLEFDRDGTEVWVSVWDTEGEIVVLDAVTLEETRRITGLEAPTGKFNAYNTAHEVY